MDYIPLPTSVWQMAQGVWYRTTRDKYGVRIHPGLPERSSLVSPAFVCLSIPPHNSSTSPTSPGVSQNLPKSPEISGFSPAETPSSAPSLTRPKLRPPPLAVLRLVCCQLPRCSRSPPPEVLLVRSLQRCSGLIRHLRRCSRPPPPAGALVADHVSRRQHTGSGPPLAIHRHSPAHLGPPDTAGGATPTPLRLTPDPVPLTCLVPSCRRLVPSSGLSRATLSCCAFQASAHDKLTRLVIPRRLPALTEGLPARADTKGRRA